MRFHKISIINWFDASRENCIYVNFEASDKDDFTLHKRSKPSDGQHYFQTLKNKIKFKLTTLFVVEMVTEQLGWNWFSYIVELLALHEMYGPLFRQKIASFASQK